MSRMKADSIKKAIEITQDAGYDFRRFLEHNAGKAAKEIEQVVMHGTEFQIRALARTLSSLLGGHPEHKILLLQELMKNQPVLVRLERANWRGVVSL